jgi:hypothetical protein
LTHHRGSRTPPSLRADTSGGILLNAARAKHAWLDLSRLSCNHFDCDGLVATWTALYPQEALRHAELLEAAAHLGDFREIPSSPHGDAALLLNVWLNAIERALFYRPFRGSEALGAVKKYAWFLPRFAGALALCDACDGDESLLPKNTPLREDAAAQMDSELSRVRSDREALAAAGASAVERLPDIGLCVLRPPRQLHYYALFSATAGLDEVLTLYPGNRYELEWKYTGFVQLASRDSLPRLSLDALASTLNDAEAKLGGGSSHSWIANSIVDSGPMLRLEATGGSKLSKADRFAHPYEREVHPSAVPPEEMQRLVASYLRFGYRGVAARRAWSWSDIHEVNGRIDWGVWRKEEGV